MSWNEALPTLAMPRLEARSARLVPLLIQVPDLGSKPRRAFRTLPRCDRAVLLGGRRRRKRRLRKEVRITLWTVAAAFFLTIAWNQRYAMGLDRCLAATSAVMVSRPYVASDMNSARPISWNHPLRSGSSAPSVLLSIDPVGAPFEDDVETRVILPGYLLPDDNHEEPAHEGS